MEVISLHSLKDATFIGTEIYISNVACFARLALIISQTHTISMSNNNRKTYHMYYNSTDRLIYPLTVRVIGAPQTILQPVSSIFPCSPLPSGTCRTPGLSWRPGILKILELKRPILKLPPPPPCNA